MRMNNKKAISTVIATSLIVLITVAAVAILWAAIIPLVSKTAPSADACLGVTTSTTVISACKTGTGGADLKVVAKQTSDATFSALKIIRYNATGPTTTSEVALLKNEEKPYIITNGGSATSVAIVPVVGGKDCEATAKTAVGALGTC
jgi:hypothetical protein